MSHQQTISKPSRLFTPPSRKRRMSRSPVQH